MVGRSSWVPCGPLLTSAWLRIRACLLVCCWLSGGFILGLQNAAVDMEKAVSELEESGVDSYILDLRNNPVCVPFILLEDLERLQDFSVNPVLLQE